MKKNQFILSVFLLSSCIYFSCNNGKKSTDISSVNTSLFWKQNCSLCHGNDGKLGLNGAKDLTKSTTSLADRITIIKKGKGKMVGFESSLSDEEINALAKYTLTFK